MTFDQSSRSRVDPITFEVLRHRLWAINNEQCLIAARMTASPVVYEALDFNAALLTGQGDCLYVGIYVTRHAASIDSVVKNVLSRFQDDIVPGDVFMTNDPWAGAIHQNDFCAVAPIFDGDDLLFWTGITMHELDVGGPTPGGFTLGARDVYAEPPLIPPIRLVANGIVQRDVEELLRRNTRTPENASVDFRARLGAINLTRRRLAEILEKYGRDTLLGVQEEIVRFTRSTVSQRLRELPDGTWDSVGYLDHDGNEETFHEVSLRMTKQGEELVFDFSRTAPEAQGSINCTRSGLVGGVMGAVLPMLCFDVPWSTAGLRDVVTIRSRPGTLVDAEHPAGVSMASIEAAWMAGNLSNVAIGRMLACSEMGETEAQACWMASTNSFVIAYSNPPRGRATSLLMTGVAGGTGARSFRDGIDTGGYLSSAFVAMPNVERNEHTYPVLEVYRRQRGDSAGAGMFRGGAGLEYLVIPYGVDEIDTILISHGATHPEGRGIYGGLPGSVSAHLHLTGADVRGLLENGRVPQRLDDLTFERLDVLPGKGRVALRSSDALLCFASGGGGYGDPLFRDERLVAGDVEGGLLTEDYAQRLYGVVLSDGSVDSDATRELRFKIRADRLARATNANGPSSRRALAPKKMAKNGGIAQIGPHVVVEPGSDGAIYRCRACEFELGAAHDDVKRYAAMLELGIDEASPINEFGRVNMFILRSFCCPACGTLFSVDVQRKSDDVLFDTRLLALAGESTRE